jgi:GGDEF domain-containing protein
MANMQEGERSPEVPLGPCHERSRIAKRVRVAVAYKAYHDSLTGLPNRAMFDEFPLGDRSWSRARRSRFRPWPCLASIFDGFKAVNDRLGHAGG